MTTGEVLEAVAVAIYWAAWEMHPPGSENPVSGLTPAKAWERTSEAHRRLARHQARRAWETLTEILELD